MQNPLPLNVCAPWFLQRAVNKANHAVLNKQGHNRHIACIIAFGHDGMLSQFLPSRSWSDPQIDWKLEEPTCCSEHKLNQWECKLASSLCCCFSNDHVTPNSFLTLICTMSLELLTRLLLWNKWKVMSFWLALMPAVHPVASRHQLGKHCTFDACANFVS